MQLYRTCHISIVCLIHLLKITLAQGRGALIGGGIEANIEYFPWQAFIEFTDSTSFCGGSIISSRYVMTAAHCCEDSEPPKVIIFGASNITGHKESPENFTITSALKIINHPNYDEWFGVFHDIALLLVKDRIEFSKTIRPIHLPFTRIENLETYRPYVAGYGNDLSGSSAHHLYYIYVEILSEECKGLDPFYNRTTKLCLRGENDKGVCFGDSGGSLIIQYNKIPIAVGIVSYATGLKCFSVNTTDVFTRVDYYLPWILNVTSEKIND